MKKVTYSKKGTPISDFSVSSSVDTFIEHGKHYIVSSRLFIDEIRARVCEGKLDRTDIQIFVGNTEVFLTEKGRFIGNGEQLFLNVQDDILNRLLGIF